MSEPQFARTQGVYEARWADPEFVSIAFDMLRSENRSGELTGEVVVRSTVPGMEGLLHQARLNLTSTAARGTLAKHLKDRAPEQDVDWHALLELAIFRTIEAHRRGEPAILLRDAPQPPDDGYLLAPILLARHPTIWFGDGGNGKSLLALAAGLSVHADMSVMGIAPAVTRRVAYLDWEFDAWEHKKRMGELVGEQQPDLVYVRCAAPLHDEVDRLRHVIKDMAVEFLIVDSVAAACGGEPEAAESANRFFLALRSLGLGSLLIAHTTKSGTDDAPFGSVFWKNNARSVWLVKKEQEIDENTLKIGLFNKKANTDRLQAPVAFEVGYHAEAKRTTIARLGQAELGGDLAKAGGMSLGYRMRIALTGGPKDYTTLAEELDSTPDVVGRTARRGAENNVYTITRDGNKTVVALRARSSSSP